MKNYNKTDYAANVTNEDAIVYRFADGTIKHITVDDFGGDEETFREWKDISDKDYYAEDRKASNISKKEVPFCVAADLEKYSTPAFEDEYFGNQENETFSMIIQKYISSLTDIQKRRLFLMVYRNLNTVEIAKEEGVSQQAVWYTFTNILKKLKMFEKHTCKNSEKKTLGERINSLRVLIEKHWKRLDTDTE